MKDFLAALAQSWGSAQAAPLVLFIGLLSLYYKLLDGRISLLPSGGLTGALFSGFLLIGNSYSAINSWALLCANWYQIFLSAVVFAGYWVFFALLISALFCWLDRFQGAPARGKMLSALSLRKRYFICFGAIFLCWMPYLLICYPGSVTYDGMYQLEQYFGVTQATNHHPWLSTVLMGSIVRLGADLEHGVFLYILFQSLVCAASFAAICYQIWKQTDSRFWAGVALAFFIIVPSWGAYAQMFVKDTLFNGFFAAFFLCVILLIQSKGQCGRFIWVGLFLFGLLSTLQRNNGLYITVPTLLCLVAVIRTGKGRVALAALATGLLGVYLCWNQLLLPALGVAPGSVREMLSIPFQQTARYVVEYGGELTREEIAVIDQVLDYEVLLTQYDPQVSDPIKDTYHGTPDTLKEYFKLWFSCGLRHPGCYVEAALNNMFGYFWPGYRYGSFGGNYFQMQPPLHGGAGAEFLHPNAVQAVDYAGRLWGSTPGLMYLNAPAAFCWLLILCTVALVRKKAVCALAGTLPVWITLGICCVSPVNGLVRYALPIMAVMPLLLLFTYTALLDKRNEEAGSVNG